MVPRKRGRPRKKPVESVCHSAQDIFADRSALHVSHKCPLNKSRDIKKVELEIGGERKHMCNSTRKKKSAVMLGPKRVTEEKNGRESQKVGESVSMKRTRKGEIKSCLKKQHLLLQTQAKEVKR